MLCFLALVFLRTQKYYPYVVYGRLTQANDSRVSFRDPELLTPLHVNVEQETISNRQASYWKWVDDTRPTETLWYKYQPDNDGVLGAQCAEVSCLHAHFADLQNH